MCCVCLFSVAGAYVCVCALHLCTCALFFVLCFRHAACKVTSGACEEGAVGWYQRGAPACCRMMSVSPSFCLIWFRPPALHGWWRVRKGRGRELSFCIHDCLSSSSVCATRGSHASTSMSCCYRCHRRRCISYHPPIIVSYSLGLVVFVLRGRRAVKGCPAGFSYRGWRCWSLRSVGRDPWKMDSQRRGCAEVTGRKRLRV